MDSIHSIAMAAVQDIPKLGLGFGKKCNIAALITAILYVLFNLAWNLIARLNIQAFYTSAFVAAWAIIVGFFVICHHSVPIHKALGITLHSYVLIKLFITSFYLISWTACALGYTRLTSHGIHLSFDYFGATLISWANAMLFFYIFIICICMLKTFKNIKFKDNKEMLEMSDEQSSEGNFGPTKCCNGQSDANADKKGASILCCLKSCLHYLFRTIYFLVHFLILVFLLLSMYYPYAVVDNEIKYRNDSHMFTVHVGDHRPLALFMRCRGKGKETIMLEYGLIGEAYVYWDFLPKHLSARNYTVCVYDRRGIGWSEGITYDWPHLYIKEPQIAKYNADFLKALIDSADIPKPLYFVGHSYGTHHVTFMALKYPDYVKGLVFLDGDIDGMIEGFKSEYDSGNLGIALYFQLISQLKQFGLLHILVNNYFPFFGQIAESMNLLSLSSLSEETLQNTIICIIKVGNFFSATYREFVDLVVKPTAQVSLILALKGQTISQPILSLNDRGRSEWLKMIKRQASNYTDDDVSAGHMSIALDYESTEIVADKIDSFIRSLSKIQ